MTNSETRNLVLWMSGVLTGAGGTMLLDRDYWLGATLILFGLCAGVVAEKLMGEKSDGTTFRKW